MLGKEWLKSKEGDSIEGESLQKYSDWLSRKKLEKMKTAAVLIGLFERRRMYFPLIKRPMHEKSSRTNRTSWRCNGEGRGSPRDCKKRS